MGVVLKAVRYLIALALFVGGAHLFGFHVAATLRAADATPAEAAASADAATADAAPSTERELVDILKLSKGEAPSSPAWHLGVGAVLAGLGLVAARPPFRSAAASEGKQGE